MEYTAGRVSIIVPIYNAENYLDICIQSLVGQTYKDIEILLIDDCSKDSSLALCNHWVNADSRIKVFHLAENSGQAVARNKGLENASGEWIMFLDSDDTFSIDAVDTILAFALKYDPDIVFSPYTCIRNGNTYVEKADISSGIYSRKDFLSRCLINVNWNVMCCIGSKLYKRNLLDNNSIKFRKDHKYNEDGAFMLMALAKSEKIGFFDDPFYQYNIRNSGSTMSSYMQDMFSYINKTNLLLKDILTENDAFVGDQRAAWIQREMGLFLSCLANEAKYQNYARFKSVFHELRKQEIYYTIFRESKDAGSMMKLTKCCMRWGTAFILYAVLKQYYRIKRS